MTPQWRTSTKSGGTNCVEVAQWGDRILVRDSKNPEGQVLRFERAAWNEFLDFVNTDVASVSETN